MSDELMTKEEANAYVAARNAWHCPECGIQGGMYHLNSCRWLAANDPPFSQGGSR